MTRNIHIALAGHFNAAQKVKNVSNALTHNVRTAFENKNEAEEKRNQETDNNNNDQPGSTSPQDMLMRMFEMNAEDFREITALLNTPIIAEPTAAETAANDIDKFIDQQSRFAGISVEAALGNIVHLDTPNKFLKTMHIIGRAAAKEINKEKIIAAEGAVHDNNIDDEMTLKVLVDPESSRLVQRIFADYVSEDNLMRYAQFLVAFDKLLLKYRDGKPLEREELDEANEVEEVRTNRKKKKKVKTKAKKNDDRADEQGNAPETDEGEETDESMDEVEVASTIETFANSGHVAEAAEHLIKAYQNSPFFMMVFTGVMIRMARREHRVADVIKFFVQLFSYPKWSFFDVRDSKFLFKNKNGVVVALVVPYNATLADRKLTLVSDTVKIGDDYKCKTFVEINSPNAGRLLWHELDKIAPMTEAEYLAYVTNISADRDFIE